MNKISFHILRIGLAVTFIWIGVFILQQPQAWEGYIQKWALDLLPVPIEQAMRGAAFLDIAIGILLLVNPLVWLAALLGALHLITILAVSGITDITVRDIGLLAASISLFFESIKKKQCSPTSQIIKTNSIVL